ncbi:hypothetical protein AB0I10_39125 [Streptomyces sp. NPDC050636]|uniref:hypothetical protein n=1 Tax=Streptomyces sp. NPDC050636 TaxID=3154510 RepID=UPI003439CF27
MTGRRTPQELVRRRALADAASGWPQRGHLAHDAAVDRVGVVVALPEDTGGPYHLCPEGGGDNWAARRDDLQPHDEADDGLTIDEAAMPPGGFTPHEGTAS